MIRIVKFGKSIVSDKEKKKIYVKKEKIHSHLRKYV